MVVEPAIPTQQCIFKNVSSPILAFVNVAYILSLIIIKETDNQENTDKDKKKSFCPTDSGCKGTRFSR